MIYQNDITNKSSLEILVLLIADLKNGHLDQIYLLKDLVKAMASFCCGPQKLIYSQ